MQIPVEIIVAVIGIIATGIGFLVKKIWTYEARIAELSTKMIDVDKDVSSLNNIENRLDVKLDKIYTLINDNYKEFYEQLLQLYKEIKNNAR
jgi:LPS O-antigen subunit length determinant protein (WzzB/FepE family)